MSEPIDESRLQFLEGVIKCRGAIITGHGTALRKAADEIGKLTAEVRELREALKNQVCAWPITSKDHPAYRLAYPESVSGSQPDARRGFMSREEVIREHREAFDEIEKHSDHCEICNDSRQAAIDAEGLFEEIDKSFEGPLLDRDDSSQESKS